MTLMFNGQPIFPPNGPAGPDGNPIGTVISYMGTKAPTDYLICDGSIYNISDYSKLAEFFKTQFGAENYFGGDGTITFAVPDMRNLFLRGFHGDSEDKLSGDVGVKQNATEIPSYQVASGVKGIMIVTSANPSSVIPIRNPDNLAGEVVDTFIPTSVNNDSGSMTALRDELRAISKDHYTSRPVNMAVLYCIKAVESVPAKNVYSTEETRIGTWVDGKPLYRRVCVLGDVSLGASTSYFSPNPELSNVDYMVETKACTSAVGNYSGDFAVSAVYQISTKKLGIYQGISSNTIACKNVMVIVTYTKTTDQGVST